MKKRGILRYAVFCFIVLLFMVPEVSAGWEDYEVMKYNFDIDATPRHQWYPHVVYNPVDNEFMGAWRTEGILRDDCDPGDEYECSNNFYAINGRRISPDGELLGDLIYFSPLELGFKMMARLAHNPFTNEYIVSFSKGPSHDAGEIYIARVDSAGNILSGQESLYGSGGGGAGHADIIFNPERQENLVAYNDRNIFNGYQNNIGFILNENGTPIKGPFEVGNQVGDQYAPNGVYNPTNGTYLIAWEDFRNVAGWMEPCDLYGALLDGNGDMITEIAILDDHGMPDAGNQRTPSIAYNPDKNEFLIVYKDQKPSLVDSIGIVGRIINADGTAAGPAFVIEDHPKSQLWPTLTYVEDEKKYFMTWTDSRDDVNPPGSPWAASDDMDIYARWLDESGNPVGDEITIVDSENWQWGSEVVYDPVMKRLLIAWYDYNALDDYDPPPSTGWVARPSEVRGTLYGISSFISGQVIEKGTGDPVGNTKVLVLGPSLPVVKETNEYGWFNIVEDSQPAGKYLVVVLKFGIPLAIRLVDYTGESLRETIEMNKWW